MIYGDLISSVKATSFKNEYLPLTALHPKADKFLFKLLNVHLDTITARFEEKLTNKRPSEEICNILLNIFAIEPTDFKRKIK